MCYHPPTMCRDWDPVLTPPSTAPRCPCARDRPQQEGGEARECLVRAYFPLDQLKWGPGLEAIRKAQGRGDLEHPRLIDRFLSCHPKIGGMGTIKRRKNTREWGERESHERGEQKRDVLLLMPLSRGPSSRARKERRSDAAGLWSSPWPCSVAAP